MGSKRILQVGEDIREHVATLLVTGRISDPRIKNITIQRVRVSPDMQVAQVFYSILGDSVQKSDAKAGLASAAGFVRHSLGDVLKLRYTPKVVFILDEGIEKAAEMNDLLNRVKREREEDAALPEKDSSEG